jgi:hypothetical protein
MGGVAAPLLDGFIELLFYLGFLLVVLLEAFLGLGFIFCCFVF